jgi:hypothetical protein
VDDRLEIRFGRPGADLPGPGDQLICPREVCGDEGVHGAAGRGEERHPGGTRFLGQQVERAQPPLHADHVEALPRGRQPPQVSGQPESGVGEVGRGAGQAC